MATLTTFSSTLVGIVAIVSFVLMALIWTAYKRTGYGKIRFVAGAMGVHGLKSTIVAFGLYTGSIHHEILEVIEGVFDFTMVVLIFLPFWSPK